MPTRLRGWTVALALSAASICPSAAHSAATLVVGGGTDRNYAPFGGAAPGFPGTIYQQVYASPSFGTAPLEITTIGFTLESGALSAGTFTVSLSTTSKGLHDLENPDFSANIGSDNETVFSGLLAPELVGDKLIFSFPGFVYNPTLGNLLLTVTAQNAGAPSGLFASTNGFSEQFSRQSDFVAQTTGWGLQTIFTVASSPVPEESSWVMLVAGFGVMGGTMRRHRQIALRRERAAFAYV